MVGSNTRISGKSQVVDWLFAVWITLCTLAFVSYPIALFVLPRLTICAEKWIRLGRGVYALVLAICLISAALRALRTQIETGLVAKKSRRVK
jgi:hypothetical protein